MKKTEHLTNNIHLENKEVEVLHQYFSQCFDANGNFDLVKFQKELQDKNIELTTEKESYGLDWLGKSYARLLSNDAATTLLKEDKTHNQKPENQQAEHFLIKGDNLEVLKHLCGAYREKIKMIYIDPPYNTGSDGFVYEDDRKFTLNELQELTGLNEEKTQRLLDFTNGKKNSHSAWLTFMYPRLYIARRLLTDDGVIFVSIDDNEVAQLRLLLDEVFGEQNFVGIAPRKTRGSATTQGENELQAINDYVLIYLKSKSISKFKQKIVGEKNYPFNDERGKYYVVPLQDNGPNGTKTARPNLYFPIYKNSDGILVLDKSKDCVEYLPQKHKNDDGCWMWSKKKFDSDYLDLTIHNEKVHIKHYYNEEEDQNKYQKEKLFLLDFQNAKGTSRVNELLEEKGVFSHPKPVELIKWCLQLSSTSNDIILDFFAGSGTTADAVMQLNAEDGANRKFILVQLPETIDKKKNKVAYDFVKEQLKAEPTIFEITKERILRAAKKINTELDEKIKSNNEKISQLQNELPTEENQKEIQELEQLNIQHQKQQNKNVFKIFQTVPIWEDYDFKAKEFNENLQLFDFEKLNEEDVDSLLLTWKTNDNIPLTEELEKININNYLAYYKKNKLYLMNKGFSTEDLKTLIEKIESDKDFNPKTIIAFGYHFESKTLREIYENLQHYDNKKDLGIEFIVRY